MYFRSGRLKMQSPEPAIVVLSLSKVKVREYVEKCRKMTGKEDVPAIAERA